MSISTSAPNELSRSTVIKQKIVNSFQKIVTQSPIRSIGGILTIMVAIACIKELFNQKISIGFIICFVIVGSLWLIAQFFTKKI